MHSLQALKAQSWRAHLANSISGCRRYDIAIFADDDRRITARFHENGCHILGYQRRQMPSNGRRAGKDDKPIRFLRDQVGRDFCEVAKHKVQNTSGQPGIGKGLRVVHSLRCTVADPTYFCIAIPRLTLL